MVQSPSSPWDAQPEERLGPSLTWATKTLDSLAQDG